MSIASKQDLKGAISNSVSLSGRVAVTSIIQTDGGIVFTTDETLTLDPVTNVLSVNTAAEVEADNTLPVTSAAVYAEVGNINALLETI